MHKCYNIIIVIPDMYARLITFNHSNIKGFATVLQDVRLPDMVKTML